MKTRAKTKRPRGAVKKSNAHLLGAYVPTAMSELVNQAVEMLDTDRSKFFRAAVREKLERHGLAA
jgi:hypothetical protein